MPVPVLIIWISWDVPNGLSDETQQYAGINQDNQYNGIKSRRSHEIGDRMRHDFAK